MLLIKRSWIGQLNTAKQAEKYTVGVEQASLFAETDPAKSE